MTRMLKPVALSGTVLLAHHSLTARLLLGWLWHYPYQRAVDLAVTLPARSARLDDSLVLRHLATLRRDHLIETVPFACLDAPIYRLSEQGYRLIEDVTAGSSPPLPAVAAVPRLMHLQRSALGLAAYAPRHLASHFQGHAPHLRWHVARAVSLTGTTDTSQRAIGSIWVACPSPTPHLLPPYVRGNQDAAIFTMLPGAAALTDSSLALTQGYGAYLLLDHVCNPRSRAREALAQILHERALSSCPFPALILLTTESHERIWQQAARELTMRAGVEPITGATAVLPAEGRAGLLDPWKLTWHQLTDGAPTRLPHMLTVVQPANWPTSLTREIDEAVASLAALRARGKRRASASRVAPAPGTRAENHDTASRTSEKVGARAKNGASVWARSLGNRHLALLHLLASHPLLSSRELAVFTNLAPASVTRYLSTCHALVERAVWDGETRHWLSEVGLRVMARLDDVPLASLAEPVPADSPSTPAGASLVPKGWPVQPRQADRLFALYEVLTRFVRDGKTKADQEMTLCWWETAPACGQRFLWHGAWRRFSPDAEIMVSHQGQRKLLWLEDHRAGLRERQLAQSLESLACYFRARIDRVERLPLPPRLLLLVATSRQEQRVEAACAAVLPASLQVRVLTTHQALFVSRGPFAPIWQQAYPSKGGADRQCCV